MKKVYYFYRAISGTHEPAYLEYEGTRDEGLAKLADTFTKSVTPVVFVLEEFSSITEIDNLLGVLKAWATQKVTQGTGWNLERVIRSLEKDVKTFNRK